MYCMCMGIMIHKSQTKGLYMSIHVLHSKINVPRFACCILLQIPSELNWAEGGGEDPRNNGVVNPA